MISLDTIFLLVGLLSASDSNKAVSGEICLSAAAAPDLSSCTDAIGERISLPAADTERLVVWTKQQVVWFTSVEPGQELAYGSGDHGALRVSLVSDGSRVSLGEARLTIEGEGKKWFVNLSGLILKEPIELWIPRGKPFNVTVQVAQHEQYQDIVSLDTRNVKSVRWTLKSWPVITGRVTDRNGGPIISAEISNEKGEVLATARPDGTFMAETGRELWPKILIVSAPGFADRIIRLPSSRASINLADVILTAGNALTVRVMGPADIFPVELEIAAYDPAGKHDTLAKRTIKDEEPIVLQSLSEGDYVAVVRGEQPLERVGTRFKVNAGESLTLDLTATPKRLELETWLGAERLGSASVELHHAEARWRAEMHTDDDGELEATLWQEGDFMIILDGSRLTSPYGTKMQLNGESPITARVVVPTRRISGRVISSADEKPIAGANVSLTTKTKSGRSIGTLTRTDVEGNFSFVGVTPGTQIVAAATDGFLHDSVSFELLETQENYVTVVRLAPARTVVVRVTDSFARPLSATVVDWSRSAVSGMRETDADGRVHVPIAPGEDRIFYVVPRDGSFAIGTTSNADEVPIVVPNGTATLQITTLSTSGKPIPDIALLMRYNGYGIPLEVQDLLHRLQGNAIRSDSRGIFILRNIPPGFYEFWPVRSAEEMRAIMRSGGTKASVRIAVQAGLNQALLSFEKLSP